MKTNFKTYKDKDIINLGKIKWMNEIVDVYLYENITFAWREYAKTKSTDSSFHTVAGYCITGDSTNELTKKYSFNTSKMIYEWLGYQIFIGNTFEEVKNTIDKFWLDKNVKKYNL